METVIGRKTYRKQIGIFRIESNKWGTNMTFKEHGFFFSIYPNKYKFFILRLRYEGRCFEVGI